MRRTPRALLPAVRCSRVPSVREKTSGLGPNEPITAVPRRHARLPTDDLKLHVDIAARGVGIGADLFVGFLGQRRQIGLLQALVLDAQLDRYAEAAALTRADRNRAGDLGLGRVLLVLLADEVERAAETGGIARREKMLGRGGGRFA